MKKIACLFFANWLMVCLVSKINKFLNTTIMKKIVLVFSLTVATYTFQACNSGSSTQDSVDSAKDMNAMKDTTAMMNRDSVITTPVDKDASDFAVNVANAGMKEVALSQLAMQNATEQRVKDFASMMIKDHNEAADKLKGIANTKNITLPAKVGDDAQKDIDKLSKKTGNDFDKDYMHMMLSDHKKAADDFQKAAKDCKDPDLKNFAIQTLPTILMHLDSAKAISERK